MEKLRNIFIAFRNKSFDEIIKLNLEGLISNKEKSLFQAVFENSSNAINSFISELKAVKDIREGDFDWTMFLYISASAQELHDILNHIEKTDDALLKNTLDVNKTDLFDHFKKIFGGRDINYVDNIFQNIEFSDTNSNNFNEFVVGRTLIIYKMLLENKVVIEKISSDKLLQISEESYKNSVTNFVKNCI